MEAAPRSGSEKQRRIGINLGKGGIGIGVGIILVGGALTTAALVASTFQRRLAKPRNKKNTDNHDQPSAAGNHETPADKSFERKETDETQDFRSFLPPESSPHIHHDLLSDGMEKASESGYSTAFSAQAFSPDGKPLFEVSHGKEDLRCCDREILLSSCFQDSENQSLERVGSVVGKEELSPSIITESLLHQPTACSLKDISCPAEELPRQDDGIGGKIADQSTAEGHQPKHVKVELEENCCTYALETGEAANMAMLSSHEKHAALIHHDQETNSVADTPLAYISFPELSNSSPGNVEKMEIEHEVDSSDLNTVEAEKRDETLEAADAHMGRASVMTTFEGEAPTCGEDDDVLLLESIEASKMDEIPVAADEVRKSNTEILMSENKENNCSRSEDLLSIKATKERETDGALKAVQADEVKNSAEVQTCQSQLLLTISEAEALESIEVLEAPKSNNQPEEVLEPIKALKTDEIPEAAEEDRKSNTTTQMSANDENNYSHSNDTLTIKTTKEQDMNETLEAAQADEVKITAAIQTCEGKPVKECQHEALLTSADAGILDAVEEKEAQQDDQINLKGEAINEKEIQQGAQINAAEDAVEEKEAQLDVQINAEGEAAQFDSGSEQTSKSNECKGILDQDHNHIRNRKTSENTLLQENEQNVSSLALNVLPQLKPVTGLKSDIKETERGLDSIKTKKESISVEPAAKEVNGHDSSEQSTGKAQLNNEKTANSLQKFQDKPSTLDVDEYTIDDHPAMSITEENSDGVSQAVVVDKVEESTEESVYSSVDSTSEPVWPAESIEEVPMQFTKQILIKDRKEKPQETGENVALQTTVKDAYPKKLEEGDISSKSLQIVNEEKGSSKMTLLKKYMLKLAEQNDEQMSLLLRQRAPTLIGTLSAPALIGTLSALLWPLCFWYFGLPFLKICLIAVLVMVLSKIQGF